LLLLVPFLLSARAVQAGNVESVNAKARRARTACLAGDYAEGTRLLSELFVATKELKKTDGYTSGKESDRKTYETFSWGGYGAGAACVAVGAILYIVGSRSASDPSVSLVPAFAPDYAGAFVKGAF
jgi:hypothetical protein